MIMVAVEESDDELPTSACSIVFSVEHKLEPPDALGSALTVGFNKPARRPHGVLGLLSKQSI